MRAKWTSKSLPILLIILKKPKVNLKTNKAILMVNNQILFHFIVTFQKQTYTILQGTIKTII